MCSRETLLSKKKLTLGEMDSRIIKKILTDIKKFHQAGYKVAVTPMGLGEPLMYKNLWKFFAEVKKISKNIKIILVTNALLLNEENIKKMIKAKVDEVNISLNGRNRNEYKRINGVDAFDLVEKNIESLFKLRKKTPKIFIQYLNKGDSKWVKLMGKLDKYYVHPIVNQGGFAKGKRRYSNHPCTQLQIRMASKMNGDMYPCDAALYSGGQKIEELCLGNVLKDSYFDQFIDKDSKRNKILSMMKKNDYGKLKVCKRCSTKDLGSNCYFNFLGRWV
jgi:radical SAM protein with 4Fe4S-binding SPASM domain